MTDRYYFDNFPDAFDYCREADHPVIVVIAGLRWKLFPSGRAERWGARRLQQIRTETEEAKEVEE